MTRRINYNRRTKKRGGSNRSSRKNRPRVGKYTRSVIAGDLIGDILTTSWSIGAAAVGKIKTFFPKTKPSEEELKDELMKSVLHAFSDKTNGILVLNGVVEKVNGKYDFAGNQDWLNIIHETYSTVNGVEGSEIDTDASMEKMRVKLIKQVAKSKNHGLKLKLPKSL